MIYLAIFLCVISLVLCVRCLRVRRQRKSPEWEKSLLISFFFGAIGLLWLPFWLGMTALQWSRDGEKALLLLLFLPLLWPVQLGYLNWWLRYDDAGFTWHGPLLGKARSFRYAEVTEIRRGSWQTARGAVPGYEVIIHCGEKHFTISPDQSNFRELLQLLSQRVPREKWKREDRSKPDPYNHNVPNGWRNLFLSLILPAIFLSLLIFEIVRYHLGYFNRDEFTLLLILSLSLILLSLGWTVLTWVVVRHPERHNPSLRKFAAYWVGAGRELGMPPDPVTDPLFPEEAEP